MQRHGPVAYNRLSGAFRTHPVRLYPIGCNAPTQHMRLVANFRYQRVQDNPAIGGKEMKRLPKQNYPLKLKQEAVSQIEVKGKRQADVAPEVSVIEQTLHGWRKAYL